MITENYVFSHAAPLQYEPCHSFLSGIDQSAIDKSAEEWLDSIEKRLTYEDSLATNLEFYNRVYNCILRVNKRQQRRRLLFYVNYRVPK